MSSGSVAMGEDEEVADLVFRIVDSIEGRGLPVAVAEVDPGVEYRAVGPLSLACSGVAGDLESSAEVRLEFGPEGSWRSCQGLACG